MSRSPMLPEQKKILQTAETNTAGGGGSGAEKLGQRMNRKNIKRIAFLLVALATVAGVAASTVSPFGRAGEEASPIYGVTIPPGYRDYRLISVTHEEGDFNQLRAQLGNDIAIKAYREGTLPFPDGAIIVALHWKRIPSDEDNQVFGRVQAFVAGSPVNMQVMVKDSRKYAATGGWGFGDFRDGKASDRALHEKCFSCHVPVKASDYVYTRYAF